MTSRFEGLGIVLIEAQTCGLPIVSLDCDYGPRHIIEDGVTGKLIPYNDDNAMADAIIWLIDNPDKRQQMSKAALEASQHYKPGTNGLRLVDIRSRQRRNIYMTLPISAIGLRMRTANLQNIRKREIHIRRYLQE